MTDTAMSLDGKRVVVIGGATGIGFAISELACELGATLSLVRVTRRMSVRPSSAFKVRRVVPSICATKPALPVSSENSARSIIWR